MAIKPAQQCGSGGLGQNSAAVAADEPWRVVGSFGNQTGATEGTGQRNQPVEPIPGCQTVAGVSAGLTACCDLSSGLALAMGTTVAESIRGGHAKGQGQHQDRSHQHGPGAEGFGPTLGVVQIGPREATPAAAEVSSDLDNQVFTAVGAGHRVITLEEDTLPRRATSNCSKQTKSARQRRALGAWSQWPTWQRRNRDRPPCRARRYRDLRSLPSR
jgi:hypothetical protein